MKLKVRADSKDWLVFGIFCLFLLFLVSLFVLNSASLVRTGTFHGLNPIMAFSSDFIFYTLGFYLIVIIVSFFVVQSYFFEVEKGFGITSSSKKDSGYSRWAKEKEFVKELVPIDSNSKDAEAAGIPLVSKKGKLYVDNGEYHNLVIGATGSGKTQCIILPQVKVLAKRKESIVITDPKGEIYEKTSDILRERGYNIVVLNFRDPQKGNSWNPLALPYKLYKSGDEDKAIEIIDDLALNIIYDASSSQQDPFWEKTSSDYFSGIAMGLFEDAKPEEVNINSISLTTTVGEERSGSSTYVQEYFKFKDPTSTAYVNASGTIIAANETKQSIIAVFKQKVKLFSSRQKLSEMLSYSDFDISDIGKKPTAVFLIVQDEKRTYHSLVTIFIKQCYETLISVAQENGGKLPVRTNFLLDEFANMPPLKDVTTMITAARSRQIRFTFIIQNFAQLDEVYGQQNAETIKGNCGNIVYLITTELKALEEISKLAGEKKSKKDDKTASTPLVTISDLQRMKQFDMIILRLRNNPFKTSFEPDFKIDWGYQNGKADYPLRETREVKVFDVREFVKAKKKEKMKALMNETADSSSDNRLMIPSPFINRENDTVSSLPKPSLLSPQDKNRKDILLDSSARDSIIPKPLVSDKNEFNDDEIDIESIIKKIDAQIEALEKEEKDSSLPAKDEPHEEEVKKADINKYKDDKKLYDDLMKKITDDVNKKMNSDTLNSSYINKENVASKVQLPLIDLEENDDEDDFFDDFFDN